MNWFKIFGWTWRIIVVLLLLPIIYILFAFVLSFNTANADFQEAQKDAINIYIHTNGVHTDLILPIRNEMNDWSAFVDPANTQSKATDYNFASFGWGDKGFYLETPAWDDLKFMTAFNALFFRSSTAMHVTFYKRIVESETCKKIAISREDYAKLTKFIKESFVLENNTPSLIQGAFYSNNDLFYNAVGTYSLFYTCNTWANSGLKSAGLRACWWTPFDQGIFDKY